MVEITERDARRLANLAQRVAKGYEAESKTYKRIGVGDLGRHLHKKAVNLKAISDRLNGKLSANCPRATVPSQPAAAASNPRE